MKYTSFRHIPKFTKAATYHINVSWNLLEHTLAHWGQTYNVEMEPEFQRVHVWTTAQQTAYVEFILRGGKGSKMIQWNCPEFGGATGDNPFNRTMQLVDGLQRLTAVRKFLRNELKVFGSRLCELTDKMDMLVAEFEFNVNDLRTQEEVLRWYLDLNTGGTVHTRKEIERVRGLLNTYSSNSASSQSPNTGEGR